MRLNGGYGYEPLTMSVWNELCSKADIALDIGAHTGIFTLSAYRHGAKSVCSIEPYYFNFARLDLNLRGNGFKNGGAWFGCALDVNGSVKLSIASPGGYCSTGAAVGIYEDARRIHVVDCRRMDDHIPEKYHSQVGPIKIDVEKTAGKVLAGMPKILSHKPDLIIEVTEPGLTEILKPYGYRFFMLDDENGVSEVETLEPVLEDDGAPNMSKLNRWCR
jgi:FkbM family methyltransferase